MLQWGVISMAGRERDKLCRVRLRFLPAGRAKKQVDAATPESESSEAMFNLVRALTRAAAIADYNRHHRTTDTSSDSESGDLRKI
jgi:hypothetical protein